MTNSSNKPSVLALDYKKLVPVLGVSLVLGLSGCYEKRDASNSMIPVGSKQVLKDWPDELYLSQMDSMLKEEVVVGGAERSDVTITMGSVPSLESLAKKAVQDGKQQSEAQKKNSTAKLTLEGFLNKFQSKLDEVRDGTISGRFVEVQGETTIEQVLVRVYGNHANSIPKVLINYQLQSLNPDLNFESLSPKTKVRLPF